MDSYDPVGVAYVKLGLHIGRHAEGYIDGYFGPPGLKDDVMSGAPRDVRALRDDAERLRELVAATEMDEQRRDFLTRQVRAMDTVLRRLGGEELPFVAEAEGCFDFAPQRIPEAEFEAGLRELDQLLPGKGDLAARQAEWKRQFEIPKDRVLPVMETALAEMRRRTGSFLELPSDESVALELVSDKPWGGYNWYLGQYRSRVQVNTDLPVRADRALGLMAHEAYPGHHTENALKEHRWYRGAGRLEHSILPLLAPECLIGEGIAEVARDVAFPDKGELAAWLREDLYPIAGIHPDVELQLRIADAAEKLSAVGGNAAFLLHEDGLPQEQVLAYIRRYTLRSEAEARQVLRFLTTPLYRTYIFNYFYGERLLRQAFTVADRLEVFRWVVSEPVTPSAVVARYESPQAPASG